ncbi:MAG: hypothetical protein ACTSQG_00090 [Promethearchaeota archaeon]
MKLKVKRNCIHICADSEVEEAYIEEVLGMKEIGDFIKLKRVGSCGIYFRPCLEAEKDGSK